MKKKELITTQLYACDFCDKAFGIKKAEKHEDICYKNPQRNCRVCANTSIKIKIGDACDACVIAQRLGGKSYL